MKTNQNLNRLYGDTNIISDLLSSYLQFIK